MTDARPARTGTVKLHQANVLVQVNKQPAERAFTDTHRGWNESLLMGVDRTYKPDDDEGEKQPPQSKRVQLHVMDVINDLSVIVGKQLDLEYVQDAGNAEAKADVVVDGQVVMPQVPVTYLLRLDRWLLNFRTFINNLPTLDTAARWQWDESRGCWASDPVETHRTIKEPAVLTKWAPPTDKFTQPAQTEVYHVDRKVGVWTTVALSGAIPAQEKRKWQERISKLIDAVKVAREVANGTEVTNSPTVGQAVFNYLFN